MNSNLKIKRLVGIARKNLLSLIVRWLVVLKILVYR